MQFFADADDVDTWMLDTLRLVSSEDVGRDEPSVESLLKKHKVQLLLFAQSLFLYPRVLPMRKVAKYTWIVRTFRPIKRKEEKHLKLFHTHQERNIYYAQWNALK